LAGAMHGAKAVWHRATVRLDALIDLLIIRFREAETVQRAIYVATAAIPLLLLIALLTSWTMQAKVPAMPNGIGVQAENTRQPSLAVAPVKTAPADSKVNTKESSAAHAPAGTNTATRKSVERKKAKTTAQKSIKTRPKAIPEERSRNTGNQAQTVTNSGSEHGSIYTTSSGSSNAYISITCVEGTEVFVDGIRKGRIDKSPLSVLVAPGKHTVIVSNVSKGIFTQSVKLSSGKTVHIKPSRCN
jgi:hypothetical protein